MERLGVEALSEAELVSLLLGSRRGEERAEATAALLLVGGLGQLRVLKAGGYNRGPRVGSAQLERIRVALELGRRSVQSELPEHPHLRDPAAMCAHLAPRLAHLEREEFWVILLTVRLEELRTIRVSLGGITHCSLLPREAFSAAVLHDAPCIAFAHNHPSGDAEPSVDDLRLQTQLDDAGRALGIEVVDHLVIAARGHHSSRHGLLTVDGEPSPESPEDPPRETHYPRPIAFTEGSR
jgi:DNA repair protein RadC